MRIRYRAGLGAWAIVALLCLPSASLAAVPREPSRATPAPGAWSNDAVPLPAGASARPLLANTAVSIAMAMRPANSTALGQLAERLAGPGGDRLGYLSEAQFDSRFAPPASAIAAVEGFLSDHGARDEVVTPDHLGVTATLPAAGVDAAFGVNLVSYGRIDGRPLYTATGSPSLPPGLRDVVLGVGGLSDAAASGLATHLAVVQQGRVASGGGPGSFVVDNLTGSHWYIGSDYTQAYTVASLFPPATNVANATFPTGEAVATLLMSGYNDTTSTDLPPYDPVAVAQYFNDTFPAGWPHPVVRGVPVTIDGATPPPPGGNGAISDSSLDDTENALDLEMAGSLAPGATVVNFYFAGSLYLAANATPTVGNVADDFATTLGDALSYNYGTARLAAVSNSYGLSDLNDSLWDSELLHAAVTGVSIVASSGDQANAPNGVSGRSQGQWPGWPATAAFNTSGVVSVGGTSIQIAGAPAGWTNETYLNASYDSNETGLSGQSAWYDASAGSGNVSGTEGGVSGVYAEPDWQFRSAAQPNIVSAAELQGATTLGRAVPDVAFGANVTIAYDAHDPTGVYFDLLEGTSVSSPIFAGLLASCAAVAGHPFGVLDPELYRIASYFAAYPDANAANPLLPATTGNNYVFTASTGWDALTGWGSVDAVRFLTADATPSIAGYNYTGPSPVLPPPPPAPSYQAPVALLLILGVAVTVAVIAVLYMGRRRPAPPWLPPPHQGPSPPAVGASSPYPSGPTGGPTPPSVPPGAGGVPGVPFVSGPPPIPPPASFLCPYCGRPRPAEPTRCPSCGAL